MFYSSPTILINFNIFDPSLEKFQIILIKSLAFPIRDIVYEENLSDKIGIY